MDRPLILIVEDTPLALKGLTRHLRGAGLRVLACDGRESVGAHLADVCPAAAIIDWHLHAGHAGHLIATLGETCPHMPVIVRTGDVRRETEIAARASGAWGWAPKTDCGLLLETVSLAIEEHHRRVAGEGYPTLDQIHERAVRGALQWAGGNVSAAAKNLGITRGRLERLIRNSNPAA